MELRYRIDYFLHFDLSRRWKYHDTMLDAINRAKEMIESGEYSVIGIEEEWSFSAKE
jgi:hypothetical protein